MTLGSFENPWPMFEYDTAFRCDCLMWLGYHSTRDMGKVITCGVCMARWQVVRNDGANTDVEKVQNG